MRAPERAAAGERAPPVIREAAAEEAAVLSALALRSKAAWGYDDAFMAACRDELTVSAGQIAERPTWMLAEGDAIAGFYQLRLADGTAEVAQFFIAPDCMRAGRGRRLWLHLEGRARAAGCSRVEVDSDPHAEGFYIAMGMRRCGEAPSGSIPGRRLPRLSKAL